MYRNKQFLNWKHFKEKLALRFQARTSPKSHVVHSKLTNILTLLQKVQDNLDKIHISTPGTPNHMSLSPTIIQEVLVENAHSGHVDQVTQVISKSTWSGEPEIDCSDDTHSRKSTSGEDECLDTNMIIVFDGSLQRNEFRLQCQFAHLTIIMTEKSIFHTNLPSNFNGPTRVEGKASLIPHVDDALIVKNIGDHLAVFYAQDGGVMIIDRDATLISGDAHRKYTWCFEFVVMKLSSLSAQTCLRYFLLFPVVQKAYYILGRANICDIIAYSYPMTKVWDPGQFWSVNSFISGIIEHQTIGVDIRDISSSLASLTSSADILFETFLFTPIVRCQKTVECLMIFDKIPQRCVVCWIEWIEAYERAENYDGIFSCYANPFIGMNFNCGDSAMFYIDQFLLMVSLNNQTSSSTPTPFAIVLLATNNMVTWLATKVIKILFLGHPKEEVECYLAKDVAFSEHVLVGSSYSVWEIILFYGTWFQLFGLVAARRHFKSSSGTHTADLGRRKQQIKQLADKHCDQFIHEHIRDGVYNRAVWEHSHIKSNVLPSYVGILQCVHPGSVKVMQIASTLYEAIRDNVVVVAGYKTLFMGLFCRTLLRRFFGHQSSAARSIKNSRHVRKFFVYVQPWAFDNAVVGARLYNSNLEDKVLIGAGGIFMNGPRPVLAKQPKSILSGYVWDPG
ncbi:hypothetical protein FXO38_24296 [Capsicum annuum]|nr:hypothetical protein FXO38_24296 [Capsicum annuum]